MASKTLRFAVIQTYNMCLYPRVIRNRKYSPNKKNNGTPPELKDKRAEYVPVGCGKCIECMKQKARAWAVRLQEEIKTDKTGLFVTLTFSNEHITNIIEGKSLDGKQLYKPLTLTGYDLDNEVAKIAVKYFRERWRKEYGKSIKHWLVTELGHQNTENLHLHGLLFTTEKDAITDIWKYGYTFIGTYVNAKTINYITKYVTKTDEQHPNYTQKILTSPGIGSGYTKTYNCKRNKYTGQDTKEYYITEQGIKLNLPIYYRNKIYTDEEKENLWLQKLDKQIRFVCGEKVSVDREEETYYNLLKYHQQRNKRLGYGDNEKNWEKYHYENSIRNLKIRERIKKAKQDK